MITFGLSYEDGKKVVAMDALANWNAAVMPMLVSHLIKQDVDFSAEFILEEMEAYITSHLADYPCDQCAYETGDPTWLNDFPKAFDLIAGAE